ncbi:MAG: hypothetical protein Q9224_000618 [Gallowayella concinna]
MGLALYSRQRLSSQVSSNLYTRTYDRMYKKDNKITHKNRKVSPKARKTYWHRCLSKMDSILAALMKMLTKAAALTGLLASVKQTSKASHPLHSETAVEQTQASDVESIRAVMAQIYGDIESARIAVLANTKLQKGHVGGCLSSCLSSEGSIVYQVLGRLPSSCTSGKLAFESTGMSSEVSHVCKRFASVVSSHGWMMLSILAHSESFRNASSTFDEPLWNQLMQSISQNHVSLELFFKVRALDWATPLRSIQHLIPVQDLSSYLQRQEKRELPSVFLEKPHSYVVPTKDGILHRPNYQSVLHLDVPTSVYDSKAFSEDPSGRAPNDGICESCNHNMCDCEPSTSDNITRPLTELIHSSAEKGIGVRTLQHIKQGVVLDEYVGELKPATSVTDQTYALKLDLPMGHRFRSDANPILIDSQVYGNWTRYINASCNPSLKFVPAIIGGKYRVMVVAIRNINTFEELTIGYGDDYWLGSDTKMCGCNEPNCQYANHIQKEKVRWTLESRKRISSQRVALETVMDNVDDDMMEVEYDDERANKNQDIQYAGEKKKKNFHSTPHVKVGPVQIQHNNKKSRSNSPHAGKRMNDNKRLPQGQSAGRLEFIQQRNARCIQPIKR